MRIGIVTANRVLAAALRRCITAADSETIWHAGNTAELERLTNSGTPDILLLDVASDNINSLDVTRRLHERCAVLLIAPRETGATRVSAIYDAMGAGALDVVGAPHLDERAELTRDSPVVARLKSLALLRFEGEQERRSSNPASNVREQAPILIAIGASTGGPNAVAEILVRLPREIPASVVLVQHIEPEYAPGLASWLAEKTKFPVEVALSGATPRAGVGYVAASSGDLVITHDRRFDYAPQAIVSGHPSIDALFDSLVHLPHPGVAVVLTGMGSDGAEGLGRLLRAGWTTIAQDERTSVVGSMPRAAAKLGAASLILPVEAIAPTICTVARRLMGQR